MRVCRQTKIKDFWAVNPENKFFHIAGVPEWPNGTDSKSVGSVPTQVQILSPALIFLELIKKSFCDERPEPDLLLFQTQAFCKTKNFLFVKL